jgi:hypothetical protein
VGIARISQVWANAVLEGDPVTEIGRRPEYIFEYEAATNLAADIVDHASEPGWI